MIDLPGVKRETIKPRREMGVPGFSVVGGRIETKERNPKLIGEQKYITASDILANVSVVAAGVRYFLNLVASPEWKVEAVDDTPEAAEYAEFVESCMYGMETSWSRVIRRAGTYRFYGFNVQEWTAFNRDDGRVGYRTLETRPQFTIDEWDIDPSTGNVRGFVQRSPYDFKNYYLPRNKTIYLVDDTLTDSPEGFGWVRHLVEPAERFMEYQRIEGSGFERDFRGIPVGRAPRAEVARAVEDGAITQAEANQILGGLSDFITMRNKATNTGLLLDSSTYLNTAENGSSASAVKKWDIELLTGSATGIEHVGAAIKRLEYSMAMILGTEGMLVGSEGGSRALSEDKSRNLYLNVNSCVTDIAETYEKDFIDPLWTLNGFDEKYKPHLRAEDVAFRTVDDVTKALRDMATAGATLSHDDPAINEVRGMLGLSDQPEGIDFDGY